jgi:glycosyltransferase involved in cell wall biosynthesis
LWNKLQTLDVFVVPWYQEGLCISALGAMACGCPVVSTSCGGPEEFVIKGEIGDRVGFDPGEMADAVLRLIRSPKIRKKPSEASREKVVQDYSWATTDTALWQTLNRQFRPQNDQTESLDKLPSSRLSKKMVRGNYT